MSKILDLETVKINLDKVVAVYELKTEDDKQQTINIIAENGERHQAVLPEGKRLKDYTIFTV